MMIEVYELLENNYVLIHTIKMGIYDYCKFFERPIVAALGTVEERVLVKFKADINVPYKIDEWVVIQTGSGYLDTLQYLDLVDTIGEIMQNNEISLQNKVFSTIWEEPKFCEEVVSKPFFSHTKANKISLNSNTVYEGTQDLTNTNCVCNCILF